MPKQSSIPNTIIPVIGLIVLSSLTVSIAAPNLFLAGIQQGLSKSMSQTAAEAEKSQHKP